ncbi:MAG: hypothetical protein JW951_01280, partial [Lentisphaerae bacterium]|nr:hypothetical protein [Lentisphaerota bacterium]
LAKEERRREALYNRWRDAYWADCIPFAHGMRLFGQYYNDVVQPRNPYAFMDLLSGSGMLSTARNRAMEDLAGMIRADPGLRAALQKGDTAELPAGFRQAVRRFAADYGTVAGAADGCSRAFLGFLLELADRDAPEPLAETGVDSLREAFFAAVPAAERPRAAEMLDLARASYRWRDDDNVYLAAVESQWRAARNEVRRRRGEPDEAPGPPPAARQPDDASGVRPRQLVGQPAGPGLAAGTARVVAAEPDLLEFKRGEILVCDAISPAMTFVVPLAGAVVERRGGMLIHGAIIAREYGIPCVTGVPDAAARIRTGMRLTVDGYLGIVRIG